MQNIKKVVFVGDIHADDCTPRSRKDNYLNAILEKLKEILFFSHDNKVDAVVLLGDIFDKIEPSGKCRNIILRALQGSLWNKKWQFPVYIVEGNHDNKNSPQNLEYSAVGTLIHTNIIQYVNDIPELSIGIGNYYVGIESDLKNGKFSDKNCLIFACHANIVDKPMIFEHVLFKDIGKKPEKKRVMPIFFP